MCYLNTKARDKIFVIVISLFVCIIATTNTVELVLLPVASRERQALYHWNHPAL